MLQNSFIPRSFLFPLENRGIFLKENRENEFETLANSQKNSETAETAHPKIEGLRADFKKRLLGAKETDSAQIDIPRDETKGKVYNLLPAQLKSPEKPQSRLAA